MRNEERSFPKSKQSRSIGQLVELVGDKFNGLKPKKSVMCIYATGSEFLPSPSRFMNKIDTEMTRGGQIFQCPFPQLWMLIDCREPTRESRQVSLCYL